MSIIQGFGLKRDGIFKLRNLTSGQLGVSPTFGKITTTHYLIYGNELFNSLRSYGLLYDDKE